MSISYVTDGAILYFDANDTASYTEGAEFLNDTLGSTTTLETNSGVTTFLNNGGLDLSAADNELTLSEAVTFRTISLWYKKIDSYLANPLFLTTDTGSYLGYLASREIGQGGYSGGAFFPTASVYIDGVLSDIAVGWNDLADGELHNIVFMGSTDVTGKMTINGSGISTSFTSSMIFYSAIFYDKVLTEAELIQNYNAGLPLIALSAGSVYITVSSNEDLVNPYRRIDFTDSESNTTTSITGSTDLEYTIQNLTPETTYTVDFYNSTDGSTYTLLESGSITTLENTSENFDISKFFDGLVYDFSSLNSETLGIIGEILNEILSTDDTITISDTTGETHYASFINIGDTVGLEDASVFYIPFEPIGGSGQEVNLNLSDSSTSILTYDESNETITVDGVTYSPGDTFYLDGKIVEVRTS